MDLIIAENLGAIFAWKNASARPESPSRRQSPGAEAACPQHDWDLEKGASLQKMKIGF
jgi:hypothetical protein